MARGWRARLRRRLFRRPLLLPACAFIAGIVLSEHFPGLNFYVILLACVLASIAAGGALRSHLAAAAVACTAAGLVWSILVAVLYDVPHHRRQRENNLATGIAVAGSVPPGSTLFTAPYIDPVMKVIDTPDVWVAFPAQDGFESFPVVLEGSLARGRRADAARRGCSAPPSARV